MSRWDLRGQVPHIVELLADPCVNIAFEGDVARVVGVSTRLWRRELSGLGLVRAVKLKAGCARAVLGRPAHAFTDRVVPLAAVLNAAQVSDLTRAVLGPADDEEGLATLACWVESLVPHGPDQSCRQATALVERIRRTSELASVGALSRLAGLGPRALQRLFRLEVGASPKWVVRRHRLQEAAARLEQGDRLSLADLAAELGYADHAHFTRDFKAATGRVPSAFVRQVWR